MESGELVECDLIDLELGLVAWVYIYSASLLAKKFKKNKKTRGKNVPMADSV